MYRVIKFFRDLQDNNHAYHVGDEFPHDGMEVSDYRLLELSTEANRRHEPLIEWVENRAEVAQIEEPVEGFMNPPEEAEEPEATPEEKPEEPKEKSQKPKKKRGRPRNDAE
jgi:hypothetical protein